MKPRHTQLNENPAQNFRGPSKRNNRAKPANLSAFRTLTIFVYVFVIVIGAGYLAVNKHVSTSGYELREMETQAEDLTQGNKDLQLKIVQLQSLSYLQTVSAELALQATQQVTYVDGTGPVAFQD